MRTMAGFEALIEEKEEFDSFSFFVSGGSEMKVLSAEFLENSVLKHL